MFDSLLPRPEDLTVGLILRSRDDSAPSLLSTHGDRTPRERAYLDFDAVEQRFGIQDADLAVVQRFADRNGLEVAEVNRNARMVLIRGPLLKVVGAFHISLEFDRIGKSIVHFLSGDTSHLLDGNELSGVVEAIFGLDTRPHFDFLHFSLQSLGLPWSRGGDQPDTATTSEPDRVWTPPAEMIRRYRFPTTTGRGQTIGIVTLGGGFYEEDLKAFFGDRMPELVVIPIGDAKNDPASKADIDTYIKALRTGQMPAMDEAVASQVAWTIETTQDIQLIGSFAPDARIVLYIAKNDELGEICALLTALNDRKDDIDVLSCSWGSGEGKVDPKLATCCEKALQVAALRGVTACFASGDKGADIVDGNPNAHFPSTCPTALSCGGTTPHSEDTNPDAVWNESRGPYTAASGGGFSRFFDTPTWQAGTGGADRPSGRGVPDVAAKADLTTGYKMIVGGQEISGGGTSAATPLWAALIARCNEATGHRAGWLTPLLYTDHLSPALRRVPVGDNGYFHATAHWDACTGWGTPDGEKLVELLGPKLSG